MLVSKNFININVPASGAAPTPPPVTNLRPDTSSVKVLTPRIDRAGQ